MELAEALLLRRSDVLHLSVGGWLAGGHRWTALRRYARRHAFIELSDRRARYSSDADADDALVHRLKQAMHPQAPRGVLPTRAA